MKSNITLFIAIAAGMLLTSFSFVSCNQTLPERPAMEGRWEGDRYTNERANFSVTLPEGVKMTDPVNYDDEVENKVAHHFVWGITTPEGNSSLFYSEIRYTTESYKYGSIVDQLKKKPELSNIEYEPWYKLYRYKIENDRTYGGVTYHEITYVRVYDYLLLSYPLDAEGHNSTMEQFAQQMEVGYPYSNCILNYDEELGCLFFLVVFGIAALLIFTGIHFGFATGILSMLIAAGGCGWLGWFMTGVPCTFTYIYTGILVAVPIGIFIAVWVNRDRL